MFKKIAIVTTTTIALSTYALSSEFMDASWAKQMCKTWNNSSTLQTGLAKWAQNDKKRGYKLVQVYRTHCGVKSKIQLNIISKNGKSYCQSAGKPDGKKMDYDVDYLMHASDKDWNCMGKASFGCGAMGAMMSGKLQFKGPKMEAMKVMSPFGEFLKLTGSVGKNDSNTCPK